MCLSFPSISLEYLLFLLFNFKDDGTQNLDIANKYSQFHTFKYNYKKS